MATSQESRYHSDATSMSLKIDRFASTQQYLNSILYQFFYVRTYIANVANAAKRLIRLIREAWAAETRFIVVTHLHCTFAHFDSMHCNFSSPTVDNTNVRLITQSICKPKIILAHLSIFLIHIDVYFHSN